MERTLKEGWGKVREERWMEWGFLLGLGRTDVGMLKARLNE